MIIFEETRIISKSSGLSVYILNLVLLALMFVAYAFPASAARRCQGSNDNDCWNDLSGQNFLDVAVDRGIACFQTPAPHSPQCFLPKGTSGYRGFKSPEVIYSMGSSGGRQEWPQVRDIAVSGAVPVRNPSRLWCGRNAQGDRQTCTKPPPSSHYVSTLYALMDDGGVWRADAHGYSDADPTGQTQSVKLSKIHYLDLSPPGLNVDTIHTRRFHDDRVVLLGHSSSSGMWYSFEYIAGARLPNSLGLNLRRMRWIPYPELPQPVVKPSFNGDACVRYQVLGEERVIKVHCGANEFHSGFFETPPLPNNLELVSRHQHKRQPFTGQTGGSPFEVFALVENNDEHAALYRTQLFSSTWTPWTIYDTDGISGWQNARPSVIVDGSLFRGVPGELFLIGAFVHGLDYVPKTPQAPSQQSAIGSGGWGPTSGIALSQLILDPANSSSGGSSLIVAQTGFVEIQSPEFNATDLAQPSETLLLDVYVPAAQSASGDRGYAEMFLSIPSAGLDYQFLGHEELSSLNAGEWNTLAFPVSEALRAGLQSSFTNASVHLALETPADAPEPLQVDYLRFQAAPVAERLCTGDNSLQCPSANLCTGKTTIDDWKTYNSNTVFVDVDTTACGFDETPHYFSTLQGDLLVNGQASPGMIEGNFSGSAIYTPTETGFRVYVGGGTTTLDKARDSNWHLNWQGVRKNSQDNDRCAGVSTATWQYRDHNTATLNVNTSGCGFDSVPTYMTSVGGDGYHFVAMGTSVTTEQTKDGFRVVLFYPFPHYLNGKTVAQFAEEKNFHINWQALPTTTSDCVGNAPIDWHQDGSTTIEGFVDTSSCHLNEETPLLTAFTSQLGDPWYARSIAVAQQVDNGFTVRMLNSHGLSAAYANNHQWNVTWTAAGASRN